MCHYGKPKHADMRIPDILLQSVCFLCVKAPFDGAVYDHFIGTSFFIVVDSSYYPHSETAGAGYSTLKHTYLVTAAHVLKETEKAGYKEFYVRLNKRDGESQVIPV